MPRTLQDQVAEVIYDNAMPLPWGSALQDDRHYYASLADVVIDTVIVHLESSELADVLEPAILMLRLDAERARQERLTA